MYKVKNILFFLSFCVISCAKTQNKTSIEISPKDSLINIYSVKNEFNIRGPVRYFKSYYNRDVNKLPNDTLELLDYSFPGFYQFDKQGLEVKIVWSIISDTLSIDLLKSYKSYRALLFEYSKMDKKDKTKLTYSEYIPYPVKNPYEIKLNQRRITPYDLEVKKDSSLYYFLQQFEYELNDLGLPITEKEYLDTDLDESGFLDNGERKSLNRTTKFEYDSLKRIISRTSMINFGGIGPDLVDFEFGASQDSEQRSEFTYNEEGQIQTYNLTIGGVFCKREVYTYFPNGEVKTRELYIDPNRSTYRDVPRNHIVQHFDGYGNITEAINYDGQGNIYNHRIDKYEYDKYHNWTRCEMYFTGNTSDPPTLVAERIIEYYE